MDRGIQRRLIVVPFNRVVPPEERIEAIGRRVPDDANLLLAWAIDGAARLIRQRNFSIPGSSKTALFDWIYGADPVLAWLDERVEVRPSIGDPPNVRIVGLVGKLLNASDELTSAAAIASETFKAVITGELYAWARRL